MFSKKIVIKIGGMHCEHCANHVKEALEKIDSVVGVKVLLKDEKAIISYKKELNLEEVKKAIEQAEFEYLGEEK